MVIHMISRKYKSKADRITHDDAPGGRALGYPVVYGVVGVEVVDLVRGVVVHGCDVTGPLVPLTVVVVGHYGYPVEVPGQLWYVVARVDDLLVGRDRRREQKVARSELLAELPHQRRERVLVLARTLAAVRLIGIYYYFLFSN